MTIYLQREQQAAEALESLQSAIQEVLRDMDTQNALAAVEKRKQKDKPAAPPEASWRSEMRARLQRALGRTPPAPPPPPPSSADKPPAKP